jgi:hypothetical protein
MTIALLPLRTSAPQGDARSMAQGSQRCGVPVLRIDRIAHDRHGAQTCGC